MRSGLSSKGNKIIVVSILLVIALVLSQAAVAYFMPQEAALHLGSGKFTVRIADTNQARIQGLSGTSDLPADEAMLFVFDRSGKWGIHMKDMNYPIDIVWLDESKKVVDYVADVPPESYPNKTFSPKEDARYVVEFRSGVIQEKGIHIGQKATFSGTSRKL